MNITLEIVALGLPIAERVFAARGNPLEVHLSKDDLAAIIGLAVGRALDNERLACAQLNSAGTKCNCNAASAWRCSSAEHMKACACECHRQSENSAGTKGDTT